MILAPRILYLCPNDKFLTDPWEASSRRARSGCLQTKKKHCQEACAGTSWIFRKSELVKLQYNLNDSMARFLGLLRCCLRTLDGFLELLKPLNQSGIKYQYFHQKESRTNIPMSTIKYPNLPYIQRHPQEIRQFPISLTSVSMRLATWGCQSEGA